MFEREPIVGTMSSQVARIIGTKIVGGEYAPGDSLPIEGDLCTQYGVSRTTIREAIKHLAGKRLIDVQPKIGTRVLPFNDWNLLDREVLSWRPPPSLIPRSSRTSSRCVCASSRVPATWRRSTARTTIIA